MFATLFLGPTVQRRRSRRVTFLISMALGEPTGNIRSSSVFLQPWPSSRVHWGAMIGRNGLERRSPFTYCRHVSGPKKKACGFWFLLSFSGSFDPGGHASVFFFRPFDILVHGMLLISPGTLHPTGASRRVASTILRGRRLSCVVCMGGLAIRIIRGGVHGARGDEAEVCDIKWYKGPERMLDESAGKRFVFFSGVLFNVCCIITLFFSVLCFFRFPII